MTRSSLVEKQKELRINIKARLPALELLLKKVSGHWEYEDMVYRFIITRFRSTAYNR
jgi:hypothetical protein